MDGFAVAAESTNGAQPSAPVILSLLPSADAVKAAYVDTGDPLPGWANAVIPIENTEALTEAETWLLTPAGPRLCAFVPL